MRQPLHRLLRSLSSLRPAALALALSLGVVSAASAQAAVSVEVRGPDGQTVDGRVTLTSKADGKTFTCEARGGSCSIAGVPGGRYVARLDAASGNAPPAREVMIPPSGSVTLHISAR